MDKKPKKRKQRKTKIKKIKKEKIKKISKKLKIKEIREKHKLEEDTDREIKNNLPEFSHSSKISPVLEQIATETPLRENATTSDVSDEKEPIKYETNYSENPKYESSKQGASWIISDNLSPRFLRAELNRRDMDFWSEKIQRTANVQNFWNEKEKDEYVSKAEKIERKPNFLIEDPNIEIQLKELEKRRYE